MPRFQSLLPLLSLGALLLLVSLVYWPGLSGGYVLDDFGNIVDVQGLKPASLAFGDLWRAAFSGTAGPLKRPVAVLSLGLERYFFGLDPWVMKFNNLLIHLFNTVLVFLLTRRLLDRNYRQERGAWSFVVPLPWIALAVAAAWSLAPINLTGVLYIVQRMESLAAMFMLLGVLGYIRGREWLAAGHTVAGRGWVWGSLVVAGTLGLLSKETAAVLPLLMLAVEWAVFGFGPPGSVARREVIRFYLMVLVLPGILAGLWKIPGLLDGGGYGRRDFTLAERLWTEARVVWHYMAWTVMPNPGALTLYHDAFPVSRGPFAPWTSLLSALGLGGLALFAWITRARLVWFGFGLAWFFIPQLLVSTVLSLELVYEHRNYLGSFGLFLAIFALLFRRWGARKDVVFAAKAFTLGLIALYALLTGMRAQEWSDPVQHAYFEATRQPDSPRANYALGRLLTMLNPPGTPAFSLGLSSMQEAAKLPRAGVMPIQGVLAQRHRHDLGETELWWARLQRYVVEKPLSSEDINALYTLSQRAIRSQGDPFWEPMTEVLASALAQRPGNTTLLQLYANYRLNREHDPEGTLELLHRVQALRPRDQGVWRNTVEVWLTLGQAQYAEVALERLKEIDHLGMQAPVIDEFERRLASLKTDTGVPPDSEVRSVAPHQGTLTDAPGPVRPGGEP